LIKSRTAFREEVERCCDLGISFVNFHPGAALESPKEQCLDLIVESMLAVEDLLVDEETRLLLETTAGQGSSVGHTFEEIAYIVERTKDKIPVGVCIDTCHIFVAGYDIRTPAGWLATLEKFEKLIGLNYLFALHINDSVKELGSKSDRHASLGEGKIGLESFKFLMSHEKTRAIPKYLETPGGVEIWDKEIWMLREFGRI
jgi:deoxyribonuclease-4